MDNNTAISKRKIISTALRMAAYLLAVTLVFSAVSYLCTVNAPVAPSPYNGLVNLTGFDFSNEVVTIQNTSFTMYPGAFYTPEDFAAGRVTDEGVGYNSPGAALGEYGTLRILLALPPGEVYAIAGKNVSYAQRLFIDGVEYAPIGVTGDSIEAVTPKTTRFIEGFAPTGDTTEIIIHYSAFVYADGGGLYPLDIGLVRNVARNEQLSVFYITTVTAALVTAALFFFGLFLFFPKGRYLLWFALVCVCVALRGLLTSDKFIMLLLPNLDWYLAIRLEFILTGGMALFAALYLNGLFPRVINRWVMRIFVGFCVLSMAFLCLTPTVVFSRFTGSFAWVYAAFMVFLLLAVLTRALRKKLTSPLSGAEQILLLFGLVAYVVLSAGGIYAHQNSLSLWGLDYPQVGVMIFLFLNMLALVLGFARTERELDKARQSEHELEESNRMLERLDRLKTDFLSNISHEMRTPLMVMSGYAQLTDWQIGAGSADDETRENLRVVSQEALRLAELASGLLRVSAEAAWKRGRVSLADIFGRADATCRPVLAKNSNRLETDLEANLPPVQVNEDMIFQVLLNLIVNAGRHTRDGVIRLGARRYTDDSIAVTVEDNGGGIDPELLPHVFERHVSGDGGSGLGLAICKDAVESHGGEITIKNISGGGTQVTFTLPVRKEEAEDGSDHTAG